MSKFEGIDPIVMGFEIDLQGKRYVTTEGLLYLMGDQYKKYSVRPELPTVDEVMQIRQMMGLDTGDPLVVIRGVVETDRGTFVDYGTTSPKNLKGFVKFSDYPLEMACRRATNRAMRIATGAGTSIDEIDTDVQPNQQETQAEVVDTYPIVDDKISNGQVEGGLAKADEQPLPEPEPPTVTDDPLATDMQRSELCNRAAIFHTDGLLEKEKTDIIIAECDKEMYLARFKMWMQKLDGVLAESEAQAEVETQ